MIRSPVIAWLASPLPSLEQQQPLPLALPLLPHRCRRPTPCLPPRLPRAAPRRPRSPVRKPRTPVHRTVGRLLLGDFAQKRVQRGRLAEREPGLGMREAHAGPAHLSRTLKDLEALS